VTPELVPISNAVLMMAHGTPNGYTYALQADGSPLVKIGKTRGPLGPRVTNYRSHSPAPVHVLGYTWDAEHEAHIHAALSWAPRRGEWFDLPEETIETLLSVFDSLGGLTVRNYRARMAALSASIRALTSHNNP
jgi:hypothetical protein